MGRASLSQGPQVSRHEEKHRAYLQILQERNQQHKQLKEADSQRNSQYLRREQGFSVCFSGANAQRTPTSAARESSAHSFFGRGSGGYAAGAGARVWEERTVEIRGLDGEVFAIRPSGERRDPVPTNASVPETASPTASKGAPSSPRPAGTRLSSTQEDLKLLHEELLAAGLVLEESTANESAADAAASDLPDEGRASPQKTQVLAMEEDSPEGPGEGAASIAPSSPKRPPELQEEQERSLDLSEVLSGERLEWLLAESPSSSPTAAELAERLAKLPKEWRRSLLRQVEEAERAVAAEGGQQESAVSPEQEGHPPV